LKTKKKKTLSKKRERREKGKEKNEPRREREGGLRIHSPCNKNTRDEGNKKMNKRAFSSAHS
jgi:hypothetical protein